MEKHMKCRSCSWENLQLILDLGLHGWCNNFITSEQLGSEPTYPLRLMLCPICGLMQIDHTVPKEVMFVDHTYVSGTTNTLRRHFRKIAKENIEQFGLQEDDLVLDIGGNDGTQLMQYRDLGIKNIINVESATVASLSEEKGIPTINAFFNESIKVPPVKLINASGVFFHLEELHSVIRTIKEILRPDGVFVVQCMYLGDMLQKASFDGIYHEHLCYYSLNSLMNLLSPYYLHVFDAYHSEIHGGSLIAKICHTAIDDEDAYTKTERFYRALDFDKQLVNQETIVKFAEKVQKKRVALRKMIVDLKSQGHRIFGIGAPAKGNTLLTYCGLDHSLIESLSEFNPLKVGLFSPVTHVPIVLENPDDLPNNSYLLVLSWNFWEEIFTKYKDVAQSKNLKFIIPMPELRIV
jgi:hypothetical protein